MGVTRIDELKVGQGRAKIVTDLPTSPDGYYGTGVGHVNSRDWRGGELCYLSTDTRFYIQTATSGATATWKRLLEATVAV
jgi:hypothetical protein